MLLTKATFYVLIIIGNIVTASTPECLSRDVVAAGRPCARACSQDGTCRKRNKECVCDGLCGLSCLRKRCPTLTVPLNGNMVVNPPVRTIGAEVTYSCNDGYVLSGQRNRICQANKTWSGTEPMCTDSTTEVPSQECAERDTAAAGRNCRKACQPDGTCIKDNRECMCDGLCGLTCLKKRCPPLPTPRNGSFVINPDDRIIGAEVTYSCNNGYFISGRENRICQANKTWSGTQPTCTQPTTEVPCPILDLEDGALAYLDNNNQRIFEPHHGDIRVAVCNDGRLLRGTSQTRCISGSWQHALPSCEVEPCSVASLERYNMDIQYAVPPGSNEIEAGLKPAGTTANFICRQYGFEASRTKRCERGRWRGADPVCLRIPCDDELLENGDFTYTLNGVQYEDPVHGVVRSYNCYAGYTVEDDRPSQCDAGSWTRGLSNCIEIRCPTTQLDNGVLEYRDIDSRVTLDPKHTDFRIATCNTGYDLQGAEETQCLVGEWEDELPVCLEGPP
ncbi:Sushi, von Willebrand factor type A, EGF and pentraxin domain-containing protein 1 [Holothuria leucospilota]|uniref:Sushi, von Willebrand factor type A, EGF and pentraxin domain-containing protein 1 n=1 Tax=Holothuria leucospilota TaxID=206669 RepID=A0A9Q1HA18_HOLLE|nr:Sushi, von Willebrand factor type A, EGF and pentraxin domain-containing protein 1 [Holothuria leucospilota]